MYYANCEWYVDMGEHYKPLCERNSLRPAKCSECPVYIGSIEAENAKLRDLCSALYEFAYDEYPDSAELNFADRMRELRIGVDG